ncbi:resolvase domain-containing protein : Resolvase OS=Rhodopirellula sallentina SM41 GN=RSSM_03343 PE=4 SV=1: Resolvase: Recombinase [Gemmataceae bacterium]|nr:resolvase domain-containing protein : Resolvase OS=Rhodopirellula sallentina SM41 GN=RSSM_03343 PE=4 SV=1: Resolvase: Recombinase [Gemmataceae bacterium]VTU01623.1 resolvase domain-containing protein : Resolvase OS=Rhodopirellula sallentina SM41 GN=RSSM_03343 PE=4 SV=1: Resolvase: Recombinase [Gemmataceae bacterium]
MSRAFSYIRFSSKKQQKGESFRRQADFAVEVCRENGWVLDETLTLNDLGVSAFRGNNAKVGALAEFLEAIRTGRVLRGSVLIIESIDRLSRNKVGEALQLFISILNSGVAIVTREPRRTYTQDSINDIAALLEPLIYMSRAHEESATKSFRLKDAWAKKKERAATQGLPMTKMAPRWLELTENGYMLIPERAATVREIFRLSVEGLGVQRILNYLVAHPEKHPPFGDSGRWRDSYVLQILSNRATFGEFQPQMREEGNLRVDCGEPIKNYFPPVVSEDLFYQVQAGMKARFRVLGRPGEYETNLFTGIVFHAEDRTTMSVHTFRQATTAGGETRPYRYLTSGATANGSTRRGKALSFPYPPFEQGVLQALSELTAADILGGEDDGDEREAEIAGLTGKLVVLDHRIQDAEQKASDPTEENPEVYVGLLKTLHKTKRETVQRLEELKADAASCKAVNLGEVQSLLGLLASVKGDELKEVRRKLKAKVRSLVTEIWVHITRVTHMTRVAQVQIHLRNGTIKKLAIQHTSGLRAKSRKST